MSDTFTPATQPITDQQRRELGEFPNLDTPYQPPVEAVPGVGGIPGVQAPKS